MQYYYDILANLDTVYWKFYEWEATDPILAIKKIPIVRVSEKDLETMIEYNVEFDPNWIINYTKKTVIKNQKEKESCILFSNIKQNIILEITETGEVISRSLLLVEDEIECMEVALTLEEEKIPLKKKEKLPNSKEFRQAKKEKDMIQIELNTLKETKNQKKCSYLYFEWFKELQEDLNKMLNKMESELKKDYTKQIHKIASLIKLSYKERL